MTTPELFHIVPASGRSLGWLLVVLALVALLTVGTLVALGRSALGARSATFEVTPAGLRLRGDLYGRLVPAAKLRGDAARVVDLGATPELRPVARTMGTALPGYRSGWFRLADGEKALLYLTETRRVAYVPTTAGYALLLSADRPEELVAKVREIAR